jgi:hypothetical protein
MPLPDHDTMKTLLDAGAIGVLSLVIILLVGMIVYLIKQIVNLANRLAEVSTKVTEVLTRVQETIISISAVLAECRHILESGGGTHAGGPRQQ